MSATAYGQPFTLATVRELIADLELLADGARIHCVVDAHDLITFCFPLGPFRQSEGGPALPSSNDIAKAQVALHALFYQTSHRPFLLDEYRQELESLRSFMAWQLDKVYTTLDVVTRLAHASTEPDPEDPQLVQLAAEDFKLVLAVATGLISCGLQQWSDILRHRVIDEHQMASALYQRLIDYVPSPIFESIREGVLRTLPRAAQKPDVIELRRRAADRDARAIDKILFLNRDHRRQPSDHPNGRHLFFYASSAPRSETLFELPQVKSLLPIVKGRSVRLLKSPSYWYAYAVHRVEGERGGVHPAAMIEELEKTADVLQTLDRWQKKDAEREKCADCVQDGKRGSSGKDDLPCEFVTECRRIRRLRGEFTADRRRLHNLSLSAKMASYEGLMTAVENEQQAALRDHPVIARRFAVLKAVQADAGFPDLALNRMEDLRNLMDWLSKEDEEDPTGTNDSNITVVDQRLPIAINFPDAEYQHVWGNVRAYYVAGAAQRGKMRDKLDEGLSSFRKLSAQGLEPTQQAQYELLRSLIFMAFPKQEGDRKAYDLASSGATRFREFDLEFMCVATWAARRLGRFKTAELQAKRAIAQHGPDARLFHGLALNAFAWKMSEPRNPARSLLEAVGYLETAIALYERGGVELHRNLIAANLHNLAFFSTCDLHDPAYDVVRAREAIDRLKDVLPKGGWSVRVPEYHHGEALVELREFQEEFAANGDRNIELLRKKLVAARSEIDIALATQSKRIYLELREEVERELALRGGALPLQ